MPPGHHASAPHYCESGINTVASVGSAYADEVCHSAESPVSTDQSPQPVTLHYPVAVEMSPVVPLSPISFAAKAHIQIVGNTDKPKFNRIQVQLIRHDLSTETHESVFNF